MYILSGYISLFYNVALASAVPQSESSVCLYIYPLCDNFMFHTLSQTNETLVQFSFLVFFFKIFFFDADYLSLYWICFNIACVLLFWFFGREARGILVSWPGIEPAALAVEGEVLTIGPGRSCLWLLF